MVKFFVQVPAPPENNQRKSDSDSRDMWIMRLQTHGNFHEGPQQLPTKIMKTS